MRCASLDLPVEQISNWMRLGFLYSVRGDTLSGKDQRIHAMSANCINRSIILSYIKSYILEYNSDHKF